MTSLAALQADDPQRVGPYVLLGRLGSGGMGRVYLARSPGGRQVAVKVIRPQLAEDDGFRARFAREVSAARKVGGLFTAQVVDADLDSPLPWLVTAYVPGTSLSQAVEQQGPLPAATTLALAAGLAEGLNAIHAAGVVHRDLKPSNVLLAPDGPRIIDFGIASAADSTSLTGTGIMIGSPGFMSPEQAEGMPVGPPSDIFSLAGVLIFAARGEGPFGSGDTAALLYRVVHGAPNLDNIPDKIRPLISRCLSHDPARRPTASGFLAELTVAYPSAADLTDWLPAGIRELSARLGTEADSRSRSRSFSRGGAAAGSGAAAGAGAGAGPGAGPVVGTGAGSGVRAVRAVPGDGSVADGGRLAVPGEPAAAGTVGAHAESAASPGPTATTEPMSVAGPAAVAGAAANGGAAASGLATRGNTSAQPTQTARSAVRPPAEAVSSRPQAYPAPEGYRGPAAWPQDTPGWGAAQPGGGPRQPGGGPQQTGQGAGQWYSPLMQPAPRRRARWPWAVGAIAALCAVIVTAVILSLGSSGHSGAPVQATTSSRPSSTASSATATPTLGDLQLYQLRAGDCLTGANMELNTTDPWPKVTLAVPCSQPHTAEVFFADNRFWPKNSPFPGSSKISKVGNAACNDAFRTYVGIAYSKSIYTWTNIIPDGSTWPAGDRALHCVAYYSTSKKPAGATLTHSIKGSRK